MVPFSKCFFIDFLIRVFFLWNSIPGYFFNIYFMTDWKDIPDLSLEDCKGNKKYSKKQMLPKDDQDQDELRVGTHPYCFDKDVFHFVLRACKVGHGDFFVCGDASPCRNCPFHLLGFGFLMLDAIFHPATRRSNTSSVKGDGSVRFKRYFTVIVTTLILIFITSSP